MRVRAATTPRPVQRKRIHHRAGADVAVEIVKAAQHRFAMHPHRNRIRPRSTGTPPTVGDRKPSAEIAGLQPGRAVPRHLDRHRNRNQRSRSIPYERTVASLHPAASRSPKNDATAPTGWSAGPSNRYGSHFDPVAASDPTARTSNTDRSRTSSKSSNMAPTVGPLSVHHDADMPERRN